jgi:hypothetical protein
VKEAKYSQQEIHSEVLPHSSHDDDDDDSDDDDDDSDDVILLSLSLSSTIASLYHSVV